MAGAMQMRGRENRDTADRERAMPKGGGEQSGAEQSVIHHNDDGTHSVTHHDGSESGPHEHIHGAMAEIGSRKEGGIHHMTHHDGMGGGFTTHHAQHGESAEGPNEHGDLESVKGELDGVMGGGQGDDQQEEVQAGGKQAGEDEY